MDFNIMTIRKYGDWSDSYYYPAIDEEGNFFVEEDDHSAVSVGFSNVKIMRNDEVEFESEHALDGKLFITNSRIILMCEDYQSGGIFWIGGPVGTILAKAASDAMAKSRTSGTVLAGHIRYEWLSEVADLSEKYFLGLVDETINITYQGSEHATWKVTITLKNAEGIASKTCSEIEQRHNLFTLGPSSGNNSQAKTPHQLPAINATYSSDFVYCTQCGKKIRETDAFCKHCGVKL